MIIKIFIGLLSGITASMGLGGGFVLMIYLTTVAGVEQMDAQGMNILFFLPIALTSIVMHIKNKLIDIKPLAPSVIFGVIGVFVGIGIAFFIQVYWISKLFALLLLVFGIKELFHKKS